MRSRFQRLPCGRRSYLYPGPNSTVRQPPASRVPPHPAARSWLRSGAGPLMLRKVARLASRESLQTAWQLFQASVPLRG